ncbi:hypothetical protein ARSEF1564_007042 [Beauveria bassiana]
MVSKVTPRTLSILLGTVAGASMVIAVGSRKFSTSARLDSPAAPRKIFSGGLALCSLPLEESDMVSHDTKRLRFKLPESSAVSGLPLTSALLTFSWPAGHWFPVIRPYTPISRSDTPGIVELLIKRYPQGKASTHIHSLSPGQSLFFLATLKGPEWKANAVPHVLLIAGGAGITPCYQLAQGILENRNDQTAVTLVYGANSDRDVLLKAEMTAWEERFPGRFKAVHAVSHPEEGSKYEKGYVTGDLLKRALPNGKQHETRVFVCGPPAMEKSLVGDRSSRGILQEVGFSKDQINTF